MGRLLCQRKRRRTGGGGPITSSNGTVRSFYGFPPVYNRNRCIYSGLGSLLSGRGNWTLLEHDSSHQLARASSSIACPEVISEEASGQIHLDQIRQHDSLSPPKQTGRNKIPTIGSPDQGHLSHVAWRETSD